MRVTSHQHQIDPRRARLLTLLSALRHQYGHDHAGLFDAIQRVVGALDPSERDALVTRLAHELETAHEN
jgi:hypothetical protein